MSPRRSLDIRLLIAIVPGPDHVPETLRVVVRRLGQAARHTTPDDGPSTGLGRLADSFLVIALNRRVGDLEGVEDAHGDLVGKVRQGPRDAEEADFALIAEGQQFGHGIVLGEGRRRRADVELDQIQVIGPHAGQALLDPGPNVLPGEHMLAPGRTPFADRLADRAAALAGQEELAAAVGEGSSDVLL